MPTNYLTREGDVLDAVCFHHYGNANLGQTLLAVLEANRGLADLNAVYPAGISIYLPDLTPPVTYSSTPLWD
ncbi:tail protein X [Rouxiella sp. T17]|uniref:tail protein X n=1 Tax=Rouxiella sp. T17 TaxID=3085684 RepID=UPI002FC970B9